MKKVCEDWRQAFAPAQMGEHLLPEFEKRATAASAEIFRVKTAAEALEVIKNLAVFTKAKDIVAAGSPLQEAIGLNKHLRDMGMNVYTTAEEIAEQAEQADIGISTVEFGIAESGSVCMDGYAFEQRLVSMLPPLHIALMPSRNIVNGIADAFEIISKIYKRGYISFITGPSRTADIERVLTIGVHGPSRFALVLIDEEVAGGTK